MRTFALLAAFALSSSLAACGDSDSGPDSSKTLQQLNADERGQLCDATNMPQGGYGRSVECSNGETATTDDTKESCVASVPVAGALCPTLKVGDATGCSNAIGTDLCRFYTDAACKAVRDCMGL